MEQQQSLPEKSPALHERAHVDPLPGDKTCTYANSKPISHHKGNNSNPFYRHGATVTNECENKRLEKDIGTKHNNKKGLNIMWPLWFFPLLVTVTCISVLVSHKQGCTSNVKLSGGDYVVECTTPSNLCYEIRDSEQHTVYKVNGTERSMGFSPCSEDAPETKSLKCVGQLAFRFDGTPLWNYRVYKDIDNNKFSLVEGPHQADLTDDVFRVRYMLQDPYNVIVSKEGIPQNDAPQYGLLIKGNFLATQ